MLSYRIRRFLVHVVLSSSSLNALHAQGFPDVPLLNPRETIGPTGTEVQPGGAGTTPANLNFGAALALHGRTLVSAMPRYRDIGRAAIFVRNQEGNWVREGSLDPSDGMPGDYFGGRLAIRDDEALVGSNRGIYVYHRFRGHWQQIQKLSSTADLPLDGGLALGGNWAFIGTSVAGGAGAVHAYELDRLGRLRPLAVVDAQTGEVGDGFGTRLAFSEDRLVVGAPGENAGQGAAYVFSNYGPEWLRRQKLVAINGRPGEHFGTSVAIAGDVIAIGAPKADRDPDQFYCFVGYSGAVYVFETHRGTWYESQKLSGPPKCTADFGEEVGVSRGWLVTTTPTLFPEYFGATFIYQQRGREFIPSAFAEGSEVGSVPLTLSNSKLFIGLPLDRGLATEGFSIGLVQFYELGDRPDQ